MTTVTLPRTEWGDVTLREFAARDLIADDRGREALDAYWRATAIANPFKPDNEPATFSESGEVWWRELRAKYAAGDTASAAFVQEVARDVLTGLGTLCVMGAHRHLIDLRRSS